MHKEHELERLARVLEESCLPAERELIGLINQESLARKAALKERVLAVLDPEGDPDLLIPFELETIVRHSKVVHAIESLRPSGYYEQGNPAHAVSRAQTIIANLERLAAEIAKGI